MQNSPTSINTSFLAFKYNVELFTEGRHLDVVWMRHVCASRSRGRHIYICNATSSYSAADGEIWDIEQSIGDGDPLDRAVVVRRGVNGEGILPCWDGFVNGLIMNGVNAC